MTVRTDSGAESALSTQRQEHRAGAGPDVGDIQARLMLVILCLLWGVTWPVMKIALNEIPPLSMRAATAGISALTMLVICLVRRRSLRIPNARTWAHIFIMSLLNIVAFSVLSAFAQITADTSRVAILTYTMPVWTVLLAWATLGERPTRVQAIAIALSTAGLAILIYPLARNGLPLGALFAISSGFAWAAGTIYVKWARVEADPLGVTSWQLTLAFFVISAFLFVFEGRLNLDTADAGALLATAFTGIAGSALAYALWFEIVRRLPATTASLGALGSPAIGVISSILILGERPTAADVIGFALILLASACVVLGPPSRRSTA
jgi:drug/metabolite transporter (DMT)-like permease